MAESNNWKYNRPTIYSKAGDTNQGSPYIHATSEAQRNIENAVKLGNQSDIGPAIDSAFKESFPLLARKEEISSYSGALKDAENLFNAKYERAKEIFAHLKNNINLPLGENNPQHPMRMIEHVLQKHPEGKSIYEGLSKEAQINFKKEAAEMITEIDKYNKGHGEKQQIMNYMSNEMKAFVKEELTDIWNRINNKISAQSEHKQKADMKQPEINLKTLIEEWKNTGITQKQEEIGNKIADILPAGGSSRGTGEKPMSKESIVSFLEKSTNVELVKFLAAPNRYPQLASRLINTAIDAGVPVDNPALKGIIASVVKEGVKNLRPEAQQIWATIDKESTRGPRQ